jgi:hypothetical protein
VPVEAVTGLVIAVIAIVSLCIAVHQYWLNHREYDDTKLHDTIQRIAQDTDEPLKAALTDLTLKLTQQADRTSRIEDLQRENNATLKEVADSQAKMSVKVDMYWASIAMSAAANYNQGQGNNGTSHQ